MITLSPFTRQSFNSNFTRNTKKTVSTYRHKLRTYFTFPSQEISNTWRGASEIVAKFFFTGNTIVKNIVDVYITSSTNYCACITWPNGTDSVARFKLWNNVGEILYAPDYALQRIPSEFNIEIWSTNNNPIILNAEEFFLSILLNPSSCICEKPIRKIHIDGSGILDERGRIILDEGGNTLQPE